MKSEYLTKLKVSVRWLSHVILSNSSFGRCFNRRHLRWRCQTSWNRSEGSTVLLARNGWHGHEWIWRIRWIWRIPRLQWLEHGSRLQHAANEERRIPSRIQFIVLRLVPLCANLRSMDSMRLQLPSSVPTCNRRANHTSVQVILTHETCYKVFFSHLQQPQKKRQKKLLKKRLKKQHPMSLNLTKQLLGKWEKFASPRQ